MNIKFFGQFRRFQLNNFLLGQPCWSAFYNELQGPPPPPKNFLHFYGPAVAFEQNNEYYVE